jgi:hypothetical protein
MKDSPMTERHMTRRLILLGCSASLAALACGDDDSESSVSETRFGAGGAGSSGASTGGASSSGTNTGGATAGAGGAAGSCGAALLVSGSNYGIDPHDLSIPLADFEAGVTKTYTTTGESHMHNVTITGADFAAFARGEPVSLYICRTNPNFTDHEFAISCADPALAPTLEGEIGTDDACPA